MTENDPLSRRLLIPLVLATVASQSSMATVAPLFIKIGQTFDLSIGAVGQIRTVSAIAAVLATFKVGGLIDRFGVRPVLMAGGALAALGAIGSAAAPTFVALLGAQVVVGVGIACLLSSGFAGASEFFPSSQRNRAIGWVVGLQSIAWVVGIPIVGILADAYSWRASFIGVPAAFAIAAMLTAFFIAPKKTDGQAADHVGLLTALTDKSARRWTIAELIAFATWTAEITYVAAFYHVQYGLTATQIGFLLPTGSVTFLFGSAMASRFGDRAVRSRLLVVTSLTMGITAYALFNYAPAILVTLAFGWTMGIAAGLRASASSTLALDQLPDQAGSMMAARTLAVQIGYATGAALGGIAVTTSGFGALGVMMIIGMTVSAAVMRTVPGAKPPADLPRLASS